MATVRQSYPIGPLGLPGDLTVPSAASGLVIFAHGSGSSRLSPRNIHVADRLNDADLATLLFDLLSDGEALDRANVFDISLLSARMVEAIEAAENWPLVRNLPKGLFGASTGAAAALVAAANLPAAVAAVVSRGGRPDLAHAALRQVVAPTLLIVGGHDEPVIEMNRQALALLRCEKRLEIVPGATHLFEEPGAIDHVAELAQEWFRQHCAPPVRAH
jgi:pimeloyl-ACP methyl ester carboxylesterase